MMGLTDGNRKTATQYNYTVIQRKIIVRWAILDFRFHEMSTGLSKRKNNNQQ